MLSEKDLVKKFSSDVRKYSSNFEGSTYFDDYGIGKELQIHNNKVFTVLVLGGSYESNVIFSPSSFIPKSAMLNLTTVLFGESVNLLEVGKPRYNNNK